MDDMMKVLLTVLLILYIVSPVDAVPGPIDDLILAVFVVAQARS